MMEFWFLGLAMLVTALSFAFVGKRIGQLVEEAEKLNENLEAAKNAIERTGRIVSSLRSIIPHANPLHPHNHANPPARAEVEGAAPGAAGNAFGMAASLISSLLNARPSMPAARPDHVD